MGVMADPWCSTCALVVRVSIFLVSSLYSWKWRAKQMHIFRCLIMFTWVSSYPSGGAVLGGSAEGKIRGSRYNLSRVVKLARKPPVIFVCTSSILIVYVVARLGTHTQTLEYTFEKNAPLPWKNRQKHNRMVAVTEKLLTSLSTLPFFWSRFLSIDFFYYNIVLPISN